MIDKLVDAEIKIAKSRKSIKMMYYYNEITHNKNRIDEEKSRMKQ